MRKFKRLGGSICHQAAPSEVSQFPLSPLIGISFIDLGNEIQDIKFKSLTEHKAQRKKLFQ